MELHTIDFAPLLEQIILVLGAVLSVLGMFLYRKLSAWLTEKTGVEKLMSDDIVRKYLNEALDNATEFGRSAVKDADWTKVETKHAALASASSYAIRKVPDALARFGLTEGDLREILEAKLSKADKAATAVPVK